MGSAIGVEFEVARASTSKRKRCVDKHSGLWEAMLGKEHASSLSTFPMILRLLSNTVS
jgi:hypothetical protein